MSKMVGASLRVSLASIAKKAPGVLNLRMVSVAERPKISSKVVTAKS